MRAVILAAGRGGRLRGVLGDRPKCLARVGDRTLIERQIAAIRCQGIDQVTVITGYRGDEVARVCGSGVTIVHNARFAGTNSLYSLWLARDLLAGGFVVFNCDVLFHPDMLADLITSPDEDALLMCPKGANAYSDEEMKVTVEQGRVTAMGKEIAGDRAHGENVGIAKFGPAGAELLRQELTRHIAAGRTMEWLPRAFASFCSRRPLRVVETGAYPWIEIDVPEDYWQACREVLPAIERMSTHQSQKSDRDSIADAPAAAKATGRMRSFRHV